jgi:hypothetical protein
MKGLEQNGLKKLNYFTVSLNLLVHKNHWQLFQNQDLKIL